jgi:hypothetical protein
MKDILDDDVPMQVGKLYRVVFQKQLGNYQWQLAEMCATYLGTKESDQMMFSLRPHFGTTAVTASQVWFVERVPGTATASDDPDEQKFSTRRIRRLTKEEVR